MDTKANVADVLTQDNADSRYLKLSGGTVNGNITMGPQGDIKIEGNSDIPGGTNVEAGKITKVSYVMQNSMSGGGGSNVNTNLEISSKGNISIRPNEYVGFNNKRLVNIADAVYEQDAINKRYVDNNFLSKNDGGAVSGDVTLSEGKKLIISGKTKNNNDGPISLSNVNEIPLQLGYENATELKVVDEEPTYSTVNSTTQYQTFLNIDTGINVKGESSFNNQAIHSVGWPTYPQDAARKDYVDIKINEALNSTPSMEAITVYKPCRIIIGSSAYGWNSSQVDYLCDGVNDQVEINDAINFGSITEKEIVLLDGVYNLTSGIDIIFDNVTIRGNGNSTIFKRMYSEDTTSRGILDISGNAGCKICDLSFDNNISEYNFFYNKTLSINSCSDITIQNCTFANSRTAVSLIGSTRCRIINNSFSNNNTSIDMQNNGYNIVANNYVYGNNNNGIFIVSCNNNNINGNIVENCTYGITINNTSSSVAAGNNISDNTCNNNKTGISVSSNNSSYSFSTISGNVCNDCRYYGISISSHGNTVTGNTCCNYGERGININNGNANTITGNTCIRGSGTTSDYSSTQYTIYNYGKNNLICANNIMGKDCYNQGTNATIVNNKYQ